MGAAPFWEVSWLAFMTFGEYFADEGLEQFFLEVRQRLTIFFAGKQNDKRFENETLVGHVFFLNRCLMQRCLDVHNMQSFMCCKAISNLL